VQKVVTGLSSTGCKHGNHPAYCGACEEDLSAYRGFMAGADWQKKQPGRREFSSVHWTLLIQKMGWDIADVDSIEKVRKRLDAALATKVMIECPPGFIGINPDASPAE